MKRIIIISLGNETGNSLKNQLRNILKNNIYINNYSLNEVLPDEIEADLIIFSSKDVADIVIKNKYIKSKYIVVKRVIQHGSIDQLLTLEKGTEVLLVNDTKETCETVIKQLIGHGVCDLKYNMYYPGVEEYKSTKIAITPGETELVPIDISKIIDIGPREMDIVSIMEVVMKLDCIEEYGELLSSYFFGRIVNKSKQYIDAANKSSKLSRILKDILNNSEEGIIYTNAIDEVLVLNKVAQDILGVEYDITGKNIYEAYENLKKDLTIINNNEIYVSKKEVYSNRILMGYMIIVETTSMVEKLDEERRRKKKQSGNDAKYTFEDMKGNNDKVTKSINLAKKIAKTNSTVLIQGESGTGKEILAQSIHNESDRSKYPFVAINFSALSENLLESELFGYEEGAFSGAKKGGKVGLFKKAHKGTIFLDEIGDAPYHFQTRLLRVLQEREVTPVGSTEAIPIDVRIIAATNKDLMEEVKNKNFREDLFYRINVMPLYTIPLRD
ncbi:MAG: sigma-54 interaction domain-containing protein, partial [Paraclostridium sp.]